MKKIVVLLTWFAFATIAMEKPPAAAQKRPNPEEEILPVEVEPAAKQARQEAKSSIITLKVPIPGTAKTIDEPIDVKTVEDIIASAPLSELMTVTEQNNRDFILARVPTRAEGKSRVEYYEFSNIQRSLFGNNHFPANPDAVSRYNLKTPLRAPISGEIYYYVFISQGNSFEYLGTDYELIKEKKNQTFLKTVSAAYAPHSTEQKIALWNELAQHYKNVHQNALAAHYESRILKETSPEAMYEKAKIWFSIHGPLSGISVAFKLLGKAHRAGHKHALLLRSFLAYGLNTPSYLATLTNIQRSLLQDFATKVFIQVMRDKPVEFMFEIYDENKSLQKNIDTTNQWLNWLKANVPPESKPFIEQKLKELHDKYGSQMQREPQQS